MATNNRIKTKQKTNKAKKSTWESKFNRELQQHREFMNRTKNSYKTPGA